MSKQIDPQNPLGKSVEYPISYQPELLFPIHRSEKREELGLTGKLPFNGEDIWNAYELSWLNLDGLPQVGIGVFRFSSNSPCIVESKSLKLYLNSFNQSNFESRAFVCSAIEHDLSKASGKPVSVLISAVDEQGSHQVDVLDAVCIDHQSIEISRYDYDVNLLTLDEPDAELESQLIVHEKLCSHLLKSNCLITNQPDWGSVAIEYKGAKICHKGLLRYLVSFRTHNEFHEQCVERIFTDIMKSCQPEELTVYARYTRRGGLDINPWRSNVLNCMKNTRLVRQ